MKAEPIDVMKRMLGEAGFDFEDPDPVTAWEVYKELVRARLQLKEGRILFRAGACGFRRPKYSFCLEFYLFFRVDYDGERVEEQLLLQLKCNLPSRFTLKKVPTSLCPRDYADLDDFFTTVERLDEFQMALSLTSWTCEISQEPVYYA
jgi:hypothetical protein